MFKIKLMRGGLENIAQELGTDDTIVFVVSVHDIQENLEGFFVM